MICDSMGGAMGGICEWGGTCIVRGGVTDGTGTALVDGRNCRLICDREGSDE